MNQEVVTSIELFTQLQDIDTKLDKLAQKKGSLPETIINLRKYIENLGKAKEEVTIQITEEEKNITTQKVEEQKARQLIARHQEEQFNAIPNSQEHNDILKEIDLQELEIRLTQKRIKKSEEKISAYQEQRAQIEEEIGLKKQILQQKKDLLAEIESRDDGEELTKLQKQRQVLLTKLKGHKLMNRYEAMRERFPKVIANVVKGTCSGCQLAVPTQRQINIKKKAQYFSCENCGRLLFSVQGSIV
jgi:hypothetical protein